MQDVEQLLTIPLSPNRLSRGLYGLGALESLQTLQQTVKSGCLIRRARIGPDAEALMPFSGTK